MYKCLLCESCGNEFGHQAMPSYMRGDFTITTMKRGQAFRCPRCGGPAYETVRSRNKLKERFRLSPGRLFSASIGGGAVWALFQCVACFSYVVFTNAGSPDANQDIFQRALPFFGKLILVSGLIGIVATVNSMLQAQKRSDIDDLMTPGSHMGRGEGSVLFQAASIAVLTGIVVSVWLVPHLAPHDLVLRSAWVRTPISAFMLLLASGASTRRLFKMCRK